MKKFANYNILQKNFWYLYILDNISINNLKKEYFKKNKKTNKLSELQKRLDLFEFPMIEILSMI
jgi:ssRNA-specific RNase YbeY (16S rRNA maturation enzyme)